MVHKISIIGSIIDEPIVDEHFIDVNQMELEDDGEQLRIQIPKTEYSQE